MPRLELAVIALVLLGTLLVIPLLVAVALQHKTKLLLGGNGRVTIAEPTTGPVGTPVATCAGKTRALSLERLDCCVRFVLPGVKRETRRMLASFVHGEVWILQVNATGHLELSSFEFVQNSFCQSPKTRVLADLWPAAFLALTGSATLIVLATCSELLFFTQEALALVRRVCLSEFSSSESARFQALVMSDSWCLVQIAGPAGAKSWHKVSFAGGVVNETVVIDETAVEALGTATAVATDCRGHLILFKRTGNQQFLLLDTRNNAIVSTVDTTNAALTATGELIYVDANRLLTQRELDGSLTLLAELDSECKLLHICGPLLVLSLLSDYLVCGQNGQKDLKPPSSVYFPHRGKIATNSSLGRLNAGMLACVHSPGAVDLIGTFEGYQLPDPSASLLGFVCQGNHGHGVDLNLVPNPLLTQGEVFVRYDDKIFATMQPEWGDYPVGDQYK